MKFVFVCVLSVLYAIGMSNFIMYSQDPKLGKTCGEILAMGFNRWLDFWGESQGLSELDINKAALSYGRCLRASNDRMLDSVSKSIRERIKVGRKLIGEFRNSIMMVHAGYAGGGTLFWHSMTRGIVDDEEMVSRLVEVNLSGDYALSKNEINIMKKMLSNVSEILKKANSPNKEQLENIRYSGIDFKIVKEELKKAESAMARLLRWFPSERPKERFIVVKAAESWASFGVALGR